MVIQIYKNKQKLLGTFAQVFHELLDNQGFFENKNVHEGKMVVIRPGKCINKVSRIC